MAKYIDADNLIADFESVGGEFDVDGIKYIINTYHKPADVVPVVRCGECIWWQDRQVQLIDGSCRDYMPDEPWSVTCDVGINVGSHCKKHGFDDESGSWFWAAANDYCSRGEKEGTMTK